MSDVLDAFEELLDAQEEFSGARQIASVGTVLDKDAIVSELTQNEIFVAGGKADSGGFTLQMRVSDFPEPPEEHQSATARGQTHLVLYFAESNGIYTITCGDPAAEVRD